MTKKQRRKIAEKLEVAVPAHGRNRSNLAKVAKATKAGVEPPVNLRPHRPRLPGLPGSKDRGRGCRR